MPLCSHHGRETEKRPYKRLQHQKRLELAGSNFEIRTASGYYRNSNSYLPGDRRIRTRNVLWENVSKINQNNC